MKIPTYPNKHLLKKVIFSLAVVLTLASIIGLSAVPISTKLKWTGLTEHEQIGTAKKVELVEGQKTLWDWLVVILAPATLAGLGIWFQISQEKDRKHRELIEKHRDARAAKLASQQAREEKARMDERAEDEQREDALAAYLAGMSDLLVGKRLSYL
ncbi:MAG: hypothetical protein WCA35_06600, partial [Kovacikia sp.]